MISNPIYDRFHLYFPHNWLIPEVEEKFKLWFERQDTPFIDIVGYLNNQICNVDIPAISTEVQKQYNQNGTRRSYAGSLSNEASINKDLSITFKLQNGYFSYFVMRQQIQAFIDRWNKSKDYFLPDINLDILDDYGSIIFKTVYTDVVFKSISGVSFRKNDIGVSYREFTCVFTYNGITEYVPLQNETIDRNEHYTY